MGKKLNQRRHENRADLAGEHALGDIGQIILLIIFLAAWIIDTFFIRYSTFISKYVPLYLRITLSILFIIISGYLAKSGLNVIFGEIRGQPFVIQKGVFGIVRHPIYLGAILFYLGLTFFSLSIIATIIWMIIIAFYFYISKYEEKLLIKKFGDAYKEYMKKVPMLIPFLRK